MSEKQYTPRRQFVAQCVDEWLKSEDVRQEFKHFDTYMAFKTLEWSQHIQDRDARSQESNLAKDEARDVLTASFEQRVRDMWNGSQNIRQEFGGSFDSYLAFRLWEDAALIR